MEIYLVGGAVRDKLLGLPVAEKDWVVVGATPGEMLEQGYRQVGKDFPVYLHPETRDEYALARTERKTGPGYKGFAFHTSPDVTLEQDLLRRDLTINAMAEAADGTLIDPCHGRDDLRDGLLRHVSPAFAEDPVRVLRIARFAAQFGKWGFKVAHDTNALMRRMVENGEVDHLVPERVWAELAKALASDAPQIFFAVLHGCRALAVLFPEIEREYRHAEPSGNHQHGIAALELLQASLAHSDDPRVRFSVLLQALGRDLTREQRARQVQALCQRFRAPNDYAQLAVTAITMERAANSHRPEDILKLMESAGALRHSERWQRLLAVYQAGGLIDKARADRLSKAGTAAASVKAAQLAGSQPAGPALGEAIRSRRLELVAQILAGAA